MLVVNLIAKSKTDPKTHKLDRLALRKEWERLAELAGIDHRSPEQVNEERLAAEKREALRAVLAEHGYGDGDFDDD